MTKKFNKLWSKYSRQSLRFHALQNYVSNEKKKKEIKINDESVLNYAIFDKDIHFNNDVDIFNKNSLNDIKLLKNKV